mmetsp:Transcript_66766/g.215852  ORF Transcript_66766/g.215852 Transcript_66766/m.215852 type:complete len:273 (+) Transcript_66766:899-1717(+)
MEHGHSLGPRRRAAPAVPRNRPSQRGQPGQSLSRHRASASASAAAASGRPAPAPAPPCRLLGPPCRTARSRRAHPRNARVRRPVLGRPGYDPAAHRAPSASGLGTETSRAPHERRPRGRRPSGHRERSSGRWPWHRSASSSPGRSSGPVHQERHRKPCRCCHRRGQGLPRESCQGRGWRPQRRSCRDACPWNPNLRRHSRRPCCSSMRSVRAESLRRPPWKVPQSCRTGACHPWMHVQRSCRRRRPSPRRRPVPARGPVCGHHRAGLQTKLP